EEEEDGDPDDIPVKELEKIALDGDDELELDSDLDDDYAELDDIVFDDSDEDDEEYEYVGKRKSYGNYDDEDE
ncbi:MAG: hypothetical protein GX357_06980, partial [Firmicutes bacterium]|nr:hypothetical protein [Bacillota bacterium]